MVEGTRVAGSEEEYWGQGQDSVEQESQDYRAHGGVMEPLLSKEEIEDRDGWWFSTPCFICGSEDVKKVEYNIQGFIGMSVLKFYVCPRCGVMRMKIDKNHDKSTPECGILPPESRRNQE